MSWCWLAALADPPPGDDLVDPSAWVRATDRAGRPAGLLAAWPRGRKPLREAVRMDERLLDLDAPAAWVSLVLVPPEAAPLFDDPAVSQAMRQVLTGPPFAAVSTLVRDAVHFAGAVTVEQSDQTGWPTTPSPGCIPPGSSGSAGACSGGSIRRRDRRSSATAASHGRPPDLTPGERQEPSGTGLRLSSR